MSIQTTHTLIFMCGYVLIIIFIHSLTSTNAYNYYNVVSASAWFSLKFFSFFPSSSISIFPTGFCSVGGGVNYSIPMRLAILSLKNHWMDVECVIPFFCVWWNWVSGHFLMMGFFFNNLSNELSYFILIFSVLYRCSVFFFLFKLIFCLCSLSGYRRTGRWLRELNHFLFGICSRFGLIFELDRVELHLAIGCWVVRITHCFVLQIFLSFSGEFF